MKAWEHRPYDEARLFNPAFCSLLLMRVSESYTKERGVGLPLVLAFVVLPIVLHQGTRNALPKTTATLMHAWLNDNSEIRIGFPERALALSQICREAIGFGLEHKALRLNNDRLVPGAKLSIPKTITDATEDLRDCFKRASFVGKWFAGAGEASIVMALWGVRP